MYFIGSQLTQKVYQFLAIILSDSLSVCQRILCLTWKKDPVTPYWIKHELLIDDKLNDRTKVVWNNHLYGNFAY